MAQCIARPNTEWRITMTLKKHEVTLVNRLNERITNNIIGEYSEKEAVKYAIAIAKDDHGGNWCLQSVVEVSE